MNGRKTHRLETRQRFACFQIQYLCSRYSTKKMTKAQRWTREQKSRMHFSRSLRIMNTIWSTIDHWPKRTAYINTYMLHIYCEIIHHIENNIFSSPLTFSCLCTTWLLKQTHSTICSLRNTEFIFFCDSQARWLVSINYISTIQKLQIDSINVSTI